MDPIQKSQRVRVLRSFFVGHDVQEAGSVVDLPMRVALSMRASNKVEFVESSASLGKASAKAEPAKLTTRSADAGRGA